MKEKTVHTKSIYEGRILSLEVLDVELEDGRASIREIVRHVRAVGVLPLLPDGSYIWVRQYRKPLDAYIIEICAGLIEPGETAEATAHRELLEETGCRAKSLRRIGALASSPGYTDEMVDLFLAECDPPEAGQNLDRDENIEVLRLRSDEIESGIRNGTIFDGKSVSAWFLARMYTDSEPGVVPP